MTERTTTTAAAAVANKDKDEAKAVVKLCDVGGRFNVLQFPSPLYVSRWLTARHAVVGGGGGARFGYANTLVLVELVGDPAAPQSGDAATPPLWKAVDSIDFKDGIVWVMSNIVEKWDGDNFVCTFCVSHVDSFSVVRFACGKGGLNSAQPRLTHLCRVSINGDRDDPDKKPIVIANGIVFVAQDNKTVAMFDLHELCADVAAAALSNPPGEPLQPLVLDPEAPSTEHKRGVLASRAWYLGCLTTGTAGPVFLDRVSGIDAKELSKRHTLLVTTSHDKLVRIFLLCAGETERAETSAASAAAAVGDSGDSDAAAATAMDPALIWRCTHHIEVTGAQMKLPQPLLKSSLRFPLLGAPRRAQVQGSDAPAIELQLLVVVYISRLGQSFVVNGSVVISEDAIRGKPSGGSAFVQQHKNKESKEKCKQGEPALHFQLVAEAAPEGLVSDAITSMCPGGSTPVSFLCSTTEGHIIEIQCPFDGAQPVRKLRMRRELHKEPISSISCQSRGAGPLVLTTDIAQQVTTTRLFVNHKAPSAALARTMLLFPSQMKTGFCWRCARMLLFFVLAVLVLGLPLLLQQIGWGY